MENLYIYLAILLSFFLFIRLKFHRNKKLPPSPPALPVIGHLYLLKNPLHESLGNLLTRYGPIVSLKLGCRSVLLISSPSAVEECFTKNDIIFANRPPSVSGDHLTYNYTTIVFAPYGDLWRQLRRLTALEIFSQNSLQKSSVIREAEVHFFLRQLVKMSCHGNQKVDLRYSFTLLTFNIIARIVTGKQCIEEDIACTEKGKIALKNLRDTFMPKLLLNICDFLPILRWMGYKGVEKSLISFHRKRDQALQKFIDDARKVSISPVKSTGKNEFTTLMETMLALQKAEPEFYTDDVLKSMTMNLFVAGTDTTAVTLEWALSLLLNHPDEMHKLREEIDNIVGQGRLLNDSDLPNLPYLRCVINETLRLYPPAPSLLPHFSAENCIVGGYEIPKGTILMVDAWAMHRDPKLWDDPNEFKPARFEGLGGDKQGSKYVPFGLGRRSCPGNFLALRVAMLALGSLIQCFEWERVGKEMVDMSLGVVTTMHKEKPLQAICRPRLSFTDILAQL